MYIIDLKTNGNFWGLGFKYMMGDATQYMDAKDFYETHHGWLETVIPKAASCDVRTLSSGSEIQSLHTRCVLIWAETVQEELILLWFLLAIVIILDVITVVVALVTFDDNCCQRQV